MTYVTYLSNFDINRIMIKRKVNNFISFEDDWTPRGSR